MDPTTAQVEAPEVNPTEDGQNPGFKARIDELTARMREAERVAQEAVQKQMEMAAQVVASQRPPPPVSVDALAKHREALAPELVEVLEAERRQMQQTTQNLMRQLEAAQGQQAIYAEVAGNPAITSEVAQKAAELYRQSKLNGSAATPQEALRYALGDELLKQQRRVSGVANIPVGQYNAPGISLPAAPPPPAASNYSLPSNIDDLSLDQQLAAYRKAGFDDMPL
jgi:hypothetical protein